MLFGEFYERRNRMGKNGCIVIQNEHIICAVLQRETYSYVIARRKSQIRVGLEDL